MGFPEEFFKLQQFIERQLVVVRLLLLSFNRPAVWPARLNSLRCVQSVQLRHALADSD